MDQILQCDASTVNLVSQESGEGPIHVASRLAFPTILASLLKFGADVRFVCWSLIFVVFFIVELVVSLQVH